MPLSIVSERLFSVTKAGKREGFGLMSRLMITSRGARVPAIAAAAVVGASLLVAGASGTSHAAAPQASVNCTWDGSHFQLSVNGAPKRAVWASYHSGPGDAGTSYDKPNFPAEATRDLTSINVFAAFHTRTGSVFAYSTQTTCVKTP